MSNEIHRIDEDNALFYDEQVKEMVEEFLDDYFNDEYEIIRFNINFLEDNSFRYHTKIDFMKLNRFIATAVNTLKTVDVNVVDSLIVKFYKDISYLNEVYKNFQNKIKSMDNVFRMGLMKYLSGIDGAYYKIQRSLSKDKKPPTPTKEDLVKLQNLIKDEFVREYKIKVRYYDSELKKIINTKTFYFDKTLWSEARKSKAVQDFFKKNKNSDGKYDEPSTKTFIKRYLKTVNLAHVKDPEWHKYLDKVIQLLD